MPTTFEAELAGEGWHAVVLEVPELLATDPPQGLELESIVLAANPSPANGS